MQEMLEKVKDFMTADYESHSPYWVALVESWCTGAGFVFWIWVILAKLLKLFFGLEYQAKFVKIR